MLSCWKDSNVAFSEGREGESNITAFMSKEPSNIIRFPPVKPTESIYERVAAWVSALAGFAHAQNRLGYMYEESRDLKKALYWYRKAARQGDARALSNLGQLYERGNGVIKEPTKAAALYTAAAKRGHLWSHNALGVCYLTGNGVPKSESEAATWFRKAAEKGYSGAQFNLGISYYQGRGVPRDYGEALRWYRMAAEQGLPHAQYNLGLMYADGEGIDEDPVTALKWLTRARHGGVREAKVSMNLVKARLPEGEAATVIAGSTPRPDWGRRSGPEMERLQKPGNRELWINVLLGLPFLLIIAALGVGYAEGDTWIYLLIFFSALFLYNVLYGILYSKFIRCQQPYGRLKFCISVIAWQVGMIGCMVGFAAL